jgi:hypothetical protein
MRGMTDKGMPDKEPRESITIGGNTFTPDELAFLLDASGGNLFLVREAIASAAMSRDPDAQTHTIE